jgi:asparagine synthase (glutamine-hydrolysing)
MCGIAGIFSFQEKVELRQIKQMTDIISHRGPDAEGQWLDETSQLGLGHRRLSIIDLSVNAKQPMHYLNERYTITFNGEIYNYIELREKLIAKGYTFRTKSDTEVILALYDLEKENCLGSFDGMFAFAIWDKVEKTLFCARDRFGEKPFYYFRDSSRFCFASEIKSLFSAGVDRSVNHKMVYYYLAFEKIENNFDRSETFFNGIRRLPSAHYMFVRGNGECIIKQYWDVSVETDHSISEQDAFQKFYSLFENSVHKRLRSDVPIGSSLSGGLDSSSVVLMVNRIKNKEASQKTFSARFEGYIRDEGAFIEKVVEKANVETYYTWPDGEKLAQDFDKLFYHQEEPFNSSSIFAEWETMKLAYENKTKVLLDGHGADEMLAGYNWYYNVYYRQLARQKPLKFLEEIKSYEKIKNKKWPLSSREMIMSFFPNLLHSAGNVRRRLIGTKLADLDFLDRDLVNEYKNLPNPLVQHKTLKGSLKFSLTNYVIQEQLRYTDKSSMAFSREVRLPFLNHELVEFVLSLPENFLIRDGWTKYVMRKSMEGLLPPEIAWRKDKIGYEPPEKIWLENKIMKERIHDSKDLLIKEKIIRHDNGISDWQSLMVMKLISG